MVKFISTEEAAKILGISRIAVFNRIKSGSLKAEKVGRNYIIAEEEVLKIKIVKLMGSDQDKIDQGLNRVVEEYKETLKLLEKH